MPQTPEPPTPLTLARVTQTARDLLLRDGFHQPTVIAEGTRQTVVTQPPDLPPTHEGRVNAMLMLGLTSVRDKRLQLRQVKR